MRRTIDDMVYGCPFLEILLFDAVPPTSPKSQLPTIQKASMRVNGPLHDNAFSFIFINMVRFYRKEYLTISLATSYNPLAFEKKIDYTSDDSLIFWTNFNWCFYFVFDIDLISFNGWGWCVLTCMHGNNLYAHRRKKHHQFLHHPPKSINCATCAYYIRWWNLNNTCIMYWSYTKKNI